MSRFKVSVVVLGVIIVAIVSIGACAGQASARSRTHSGTGRLVVGAARSASTHAAAGPGAVADSEWALASHVNW